MFFGLFIWSLFYCVFFLYERGGWESKVLNVWWFLYSKVLSCAEVEKIMKRLICFLFPFPVSSFSCMREEMRIKCVHCSGDLVLKTD